MGSRPGRRGLDGRAEPGLPRARAPRLRRRRVRARAGRQRRRRARRRGGHRLLRPAAVRRARERDAMTTREPLRPVLYDDGKDVVRLLDQRLLPAEEVWLELATSGEVTQAIKDLAVRGAPAIGVAAAYAIAADARRGAEPNALREAAERLVKARPTAV